MLTDVIEDELAELYAWVDTIPLSRPKKNLARDFADGVLIAEIVAHFFPRLVELHNYSPTSSTAQKMYNWTTLNQRVFRKLGFTLPREACSAVALAEPGAAERILKLMRAKLAAHQARHGAARAAQLRDAGGTIAAPSSHPPPAADTSAWSNPLPVAWDPAQARSPSPLDVEVCGAPSNTYGKPCPGTRTPADLQRSEEQGQGLIRAYATPAAEAELAELRGLNEILELKVAKMEQLLRLKDAKVAALEGRLRAAGLLQGAPDHHHSSARGSWL